MSAAVRRIIQCSRCNTPLPREHINASDVQPCPSCETPIEAHAFPALLRDPDAATAVTDPVMSGESSCFYHDHKKAVAACETCGRFICSLCRLDLHELMICPSCLQSGRVKGRMTNLEHSRTLYDSIALLMAVFPLILFYPLALATIVTGPMAIFLSLRHWRKPTSVLGRTKIRFVAAIIIGGLQIVAWIAAGIFGFGRIIRYFDNV